MSRKALPKSKAKTAYGLLSEIRKLILAEPTRYDQHNWIVCDNVPRLSNGKNSFPYDEMPHCGTVGCVAGWVRALKAPTSRASFHATGRLAAKILGLDHGQGMDLFEPYAAVGNPQSVHHARSGAAHIERFQKKHATQLKATKV